jgi:hypothetical protein
VILIFFYYRKIRSIRKSYGRWEELECRAEQIRLHNILHPSRHTKRNECNLFFIVFLFFIFISVSRADLSNPRVTQNIRLASLWRNRSTKLPNLRMFACEVCKKVIILSSTLTDFRNNFFCNLRPSYHLPVWGAIALAILGSRKVILKNKMDVSASPLPLI